MYNLLKLLIVCCIFVGGCTIKQEIQPVAIQEEKIICIIEDPAVRKGFLATYQQVLQERGYVTKLIPMGSDLKTCALTTTYMGLWSWDLAIYLAYAKIEVFKDGILVGSANYDSRSAPGNMGKFVNGEKKIRELVEQLFSAR